MTTTTWSTDAAHTDVQFSVKHMMISTVRGRFTGAAGTLRFDEQDPTAAGGTFSVDAATIDTGAAPRDDHLRSADFFDAETYPTISFTSTQVEPAGAGYRVTGDLTIRGITRPTAFDVQLLGVVQGINGGRRAAFHATASIDREAWGLTWNRTLESGGLLVSRDVRLEIDLAVEEVTAAASDHADLAAAA